MPRKLKVYRTAVGFRDAYVAAPSQAAALRAWGTRKNLFARGAAEQVTDTELVQEALSKPGEVVYRTRGSLEEQVAALGPTPKPQPQPQPEAPPEPGDPEAPAAKRRPRAKPKPRPSRAKLEAAEEALASLAEERETAEREMRAREEALKRERTAMEKAHAAQRDRLERERDRARAAYEKALQQWKP